MSLSPPSSLSSQTSLFLSPCACLCSTISQLHMSAEIRGRLLRLYWFLTLRDDKFGLILSCLPLICCKQQHQPKIKVNQWENEPVFPSLYQVTRSGSISPHYIFYFLWILLLVRMPEAVCQGAPPRCHVAFQQTPEQKKLSRSGIWRRWPPRTKCTVPADVARSWGGWITNRHNKEAAWDGETRGHRLGQDDWKTTPRPPFFYVRYRQTENKLPGWVFLLNL